MFLPVTRVFFLAAILALPLALAPAPSRATPSFDCARATAPDEIQICLHDHLALLDDAVAQGYDEVISYRGRDFVRRYGRMLLEGRQACRSDIACIEEAQRYSIEAYMALGARGPGASGQYLYGQPMPVLIRLWQRAQSECSGAMDAAAREAGCRLRDTQLVPHLQRIGLCPARDWLPLPGGGHSAHLAGRWIPCYYRDLVAPGF